MFKLLLAFLAAALLLLLNGCAQKDEPSKNELRSALISTGSLAAETQLFIDFLLEHGTTSAFAHGHLQYLADEVDRIANQIHCPTRSDSPATPFHQSCLQLTLLSAELRQVSHHIDEVNALNGESANIHQIQQALDRIRACL